MLKLFYKLYFNRFRHPAIENYYTRIIVRLTNYVMSFYFTVTHPVTIRRKLRAPDDADDKLIVSLTSYPDRIDKVWLVVESILAQTHKPDEIILWLYRDEFDGLNSLPANLKRLQKRGLQIKFCDENLMPHKKYYYTLLNNPGADIITVDDDVIYHPHLIEKLMECHQKYPAAVCGTLVRKIELCGERDNIEPYRDWSQLKENTEPRFDNQMIGVGGVLYPAGSLHPEVLDMEALKELALYTDDLWLKIMCVRNRTAVAALSGEFPRSFIPIILDKRSRLADENVGNNRNSKNFKRLVEHYHVSSKEFVADV